MTPRLQVSRAALQLIKNFEGFRETAAQLPDGRWTIGHGHTRTARQGARVSADDARDLLIYDLIEVTKALNTTVFTPLNQNQFDALASFVFNIGVDGFGGSKVLRRLNEGELLKAAYAMELWRSAEFEGEVIVIDALVRRRAAEKTLFLTPPDGFVPAPTPLLKPRLDVAGRDHAPVDTPLDIVPSLLGDQVTARRAEPPLIPQPVEDAAPSLAELAGDKAAGTTAASPLQTSAQPSRDEEEEAPSLAEARAPEPVAYDGAPVFAERAEDESPLPPSADSVAADAKTQAEAPQLLAEPDAVGEDVASAPLTLDHHAQVPASEVKTFDATAGDQPTHTGLRRVLTAVSGVVGAVLFGVGLVSVYRGRVEHSGSTGWAVGVGLAGIVCLAVALYFVFDNMGDRED